MTRSGRTALKLVIPDVYIHATELYLAISLRDFTRETVVIISVLVRRLPTGAGPCAAIGQSVLHLSTGRQLGRPIHLTEAWNRGTV